MQEVSSSPLVLLGDFMSRKCEKSCPSPHHFLNTTNCKCECRVPIEKLISQCMQKNSIFDKDECDCIPNAKVRRVRNVGDAAPPPPPPPPPPPVNFCPLTPTNCTGLKELNQTACECQCETFLPLECPTPSRPRSKPLKNRNGHVHEYVYGEDGCRELTRKGGKYRTKHVSPVRKPRHTGRKSKTGKSPKPVVPPPSILTPASSCPDGQTPNFNTCECMIVVP